MSSIAFIAIEGPDGAGTTSHVDHVCKELQASGLRVMKTCEPTTSTMGKAIRAMFTGNDPMPDPRTMALLFSADRANHCANIQRLADGGDVDVVITDRYVLSTYVYQSFLIEKHTGQPRESAARWIGDINKYALEPDLLVILDVDAGTADSRVEKRGRDQFESITDLQQHTLREYSSVPSNYPSHYPGIGKRVVHVDSALPKTEAQLQTLLEVRGLIEGGGGA